MLKIAVTAAVVMGVVALLVRAFEGRFAFFPSTGETTTPANLGVPYDPGWIESSDGERLRLWAMVHAAPRAQILYFHGNGGNLSVWAPVLIGVYNQGYSLYAIDYRGYGLSSGRPTERGLYRDVEAAVSWIAQQPRPQGPLIYWGRSLGTTMAAYAATLRVPDGVIIESGFPSARALLRGSPPLAVLAVFSSYRFPTAQLLRDVGRPVLVMHGDRDRVIPFGLGQELFDQISTPKQLLVLKGADHNDILPPDAREYWGAIRQFVDSLAPPQEP